MTILIVNTPGPQGATGTPGTNGTNGNTVLTTSGAPASTVGNNGDFALDPTAQVMYGPKASGAWPAGVSVKGGTGNAGPQGAPGAGAKWQTGQTYTGLVATRGTVMGDMLGGNQQANARSVHVARTAITQIGVAVANWFATLAISPYGEHAVGANASFRISIEYPLGGQSYQLTFANGSATTGTAYDGSTLATDLVTLPITIPAGAVFAVRQNISIPTPGAVLWNGNGNILANLTAGDCFEYAASGLTDRTSSTGSFTNTNAGIWNRPVAIFGPVTQPSYALVGDSRYVGLGDDGSANMDIGEAARAIGPTRGYTNLGLIGEALTGATGVTTVGYELRAELIRKYCTHVTSNYQINDVAGNASFQAVIQAQSALRRMFPGHYWYQSTAMAEVNGSTPTVPAGNPYNGIGAQVNNWLLSGVNGTLFDAVFDVATVLSGTRNHFAYQNAAWCYTDGVHQTSAGYAQAASVYQVQ